MEQDKKIKWDKDPNAQIGVKDGGFVTTINGQEIPAEISDYGPEVGAIVIYDNQGQPTRAVFLEAIG